ncbi:hypothetical protein B0H16DRAFT_1460627 [Mycena metata]|uniref:Uncharacterized protein n=1 Tax=Mycena metata TaxID=1033252 RepID=A0AAD7IU31_9AGAR|nr:hypothetical protein B0H16DRAFT_1460627 [Mycena metata]
MLEGKRKEGTKEVVGGETKKVVTSSGFRPLVGIKPKSHARAKSLQFRIELEKSRKEHGARSMPPVGFEPTFPPQFLSKLASYNLEVIYPDPQRLYTPFPSSPYTLYNTGTVRTVLKPRRMPDQLVQQIQHKFNWWSGTQRNTKL